MLLETDFLSTWNSSRLFADFYLIVETTGEIQFLKNNLIPASETDFLASGNQFFLLFSDTPATGNFIFLSNGNVFVNKFCILVSQSGFSG